MQIEADVLNYFGYIAAAASRDFAEFRLLDIDEQEFGADKAFHWDAVAYYFQFKKPVALKPLTAREQLGACPSGAGPEQQIRWFRHEERLENDPYSVSFKLHPKAKTATDCQHNLLFSYERPPSSRAAYVCPLEITQDRYLQSMREPGPDWSPFFPLLFRHSQWIRDARYVATVARMIPYLRGHAAIVPHKQVDSTDHWYSFSRHATDVAFHSPERIMSGPNRLSDFLAKEIRRLGKLDEMQPLETVVESLREIAETWLDGGHEQGPSEAIPWLKWHADQLRRQTGIRQFVVFRKQREAGG